MFTVLTPNRIADSGNGASFATAADFLTNAGKPIELKYDDATSEHIFIFKMFLILNTKYTFSLDDFASGEYYIGIYNSAFGVIQNNIIADADYTPTTSGVYYVRIASMPLSGPRTALITPTPGSAATPIYSDCDGVDLYGFPLKFKSASDAGLIVPPFNNKNVKILLRDGVIENAAKGKNSAATVTTTGNPITIDASGRFVFDGDNFLTFGDTGWDYSTKSFTIDFCGLVVSFDRSRYIMGPVVNNAPQVYYDGGNILPYANSKLLHAVTAGEVFLYSIQYDRTTNTTTAWFNGVKIASDIWNWTLGFPTDIATAFQVGKNSNDPGLNGAIVYFRASEGLAYNPDKNFKPNLTGF